MLEALRASLMQRGSVDVVVRVRPHAARTKLQAVLDDQSIKIDIAETAENNRGNLALIRFLAEQFQVPMQHVTILSGKTSRMKLVRITAL